MFQSRHKWKVSMLDRLSVSILSSLRFAAKQYRCFGCQTLERSFRAWWFSEFHKDLRTVCRHPSRYRDRRLTSKWLIWLGWRWNNARRWERNFHWLSRWDKVSRFDARKYLSYLSQLHKRLDRQRFDIEWHQQVLPLRRTRWAEHRLHQWCEPENIYVRAASSLSTFRTLLLHPHWQLSCVVKTARASQ